MAAEAEDAGGRSSTGGRPVPLRRLALSRRQSYHPQPGPGRLQALHPRHEDPRIGHPWAQCGQLNAASSMRPAQCGQLKDAGQCCWQILDDFPDLEAEDLNAGLSDAAWEIDPLVVVA